MPHTIRKLKKMITPPVERILSKRMARHKTVCVPAPQKMGLEIQLEFAWDENH